MKKIISNILSLLLVVALLGNNIVSASYVINSTINDGIISATLTKNNELTSKAFVSNPDGFITVNEINSLNITINNNNKTANLEGDLEITLSGVINEIQVETHVGYEGIFQGMIDEDTPIIATFIYDENNVFLTLTVGFLESNELETAFYGLLSDTIKTYENKNYNLQVQAEKNESNLDLNNSNSNYSTRTNGITVFQDSSTLYVTSSHPIGYMSVYHAEELENQNGTPVYVKLNTRCNKVQNYLETYVYTDYLALGVKPETFYITVTGNDSYFKIDDWNPISKIDQYTFSLPIPYITSSGIASVNVPVTYTVSSTTVTTSSYNSDMHQNRINWVIYKNEGWLANTFEGDRYSTTGMTTNVDMEHHGNISSNVNKTITVKGQIRYLVRAYLEETHINYYYTTGNMTTNTTITIVP